MFPGLLSVSDEFDGVRSLEFYLFYFFFLTRQSGGLSLMMVWQIGKITRIFSRALHNSCSFRIILILAMSATIVTRVVGPGPTSILAFWALRLYGTILWVISAIGGNDDWCKGNSALLCIVGLRPCGLRGHDVRGPCGGIFNYGLPFSKGEGEVGLGCDVLELGSCLFSRALHNSSSYHIISEGVLHISGDTKFGVFFVFFFYPPSLLWLQDDTLVRPLPPYVDRWHLTFSYNYWISLFSAQCVIY